MDLRGEVRTAFFSLCMTFPSSCLVGGKEMIKMERREREGMSGKWGGGCLRENVQRSEVSLGA